MGETPQKGAQFEQEYLARKTLLETLVEETKKTELELVPADYCYGWPEDVTCNF